MSDDVKNQLDEVKNQIKATLGESMSGNSDSYKITWKSQVKTTVDSKRLKEKFPEVYKQVTKSSTSRVLRITQKKEQ